MKKILFIGFLVALFSCTEKKQVENNKTTEKKTSSDNIAIIEFDSEMHDFGKIKSGEILSYSFIFTNRGTTDLKINNAEGDCDCLQADFPKEPVKPGEKGIIEVEFNSAGMIGRQLKTLEIQSNSKETKHLIIFAEVENEQIEIKY